MSITPGTYYPNVPGAKTLRESRELWLNGKRVSVEVDSYEYATLFIGTRLVSRAPLKYIGVKSVGDITTASKLHEWAVDTATALESAYERGYKSLWEEYV